MRLDTQSLTEVVMRGLKQRDVTDVTPEGIDLLKVCEHLDSLSRPECADPHFAIRLDAAYVYHMTICPSPNCTAVPAHRTNLIAAMTLAPTQDDRYRLMLVYPWIAVFLAMVKQGQLDELLGVAQGQVPPEVMTNWLYNHD